MEAPGLLYFLIASLFLWRVLLGMYGYLFMDILPYLSRQLFYKSVFITLLVLMPRVQSILYRTPNAILTLLFPFVENC